MPSTATTPYAHEMEWPSHLRPFDSWDETIKADPFPYYAWMLRNAPVLRTKTPVGDSWFLSSYKDVQWAFRTPKIFSSVLRSDPTSYPHLLIRDGADHSRLRSVVAHAFTPKAVAAIETKVKQLAEQKLKRLVDAGGGEVMANLMSPLTAETIASLLGLPLSESDHYRQWTEDFNTFLGRLSGSSPGSPTDEAGMLAFVEHMKKAMADAPPGSHSILSSIARARREGKLSEEEAIYFGPILFSAGTDTTTLLIGNGFTILYEMPELLARLRNNPELVPKFIDELVRFRSSVHRVRRLTTVDVEVGGHMIPARTPVTFLLPAANRDPEKFANPDVFDMDRDASGAVGFGFGVHACLGSWLARMEAKLVFEALARTVSKIEMDPNPEEALVPFTGGNGGLMGPRYLTLKFKAVA